MNEDRTEAIRRRVEKYYKERGEFVVHVSVYLAVNAALWGLWFLISGPTGFPWPGMMTMAWGAGVLANWLQVRSQSPARFVALERSAQRQMARRYGPDWETAADADDYQRILNAVEKAAKERTEFVTHLVIYALINLMLWFIGFFARAEFPFPLLVMSFWGIGLVAHAASVFFSSAQQQLAREEAIQREVERWAGTTEKAKKKKRAGARLELTDDGELIEIVDEGETDTELRRAVLREHNQRRR